MSPQGSKPTGTYKFNRGDRNEAIAIKDSLHNDFKKAGFEWFKHYTLKIIGASIEIETYTEEADNFLQETSTQYLL